MKGQKNIIKIIEDFGISDKKPKYSSHIYHYTIQFIQSNCNDFYRRQKVNTTTGYVSSKIYSWSKNPNWWDWDIRHFIRV